ncbi:MAG: O-antigen ligase family protein, partial [Pseudomonadota bacterium]
GAIVMIFLGIVYFKRVVFSFAMAGIFLLIYTLVPAGVEFLMNFSLSRYHSSYTIEMLENDSFSYVQYDRMTGLIEGWKMFLENPLFGAGLGAFYQEKLATGVPLVIHNSFLWVLAEFGLFGFIAIFGPVGVFATKNLLSGKWRHDRRMHAFLALLLGAGIMALAHEVMYQRIFWFMTGILLARPMISLFGKTRVDHAKLPAQ